MKKVLILGNGNSCHSQMMAALIRNISFDRIDVQSAGIKPEKIHSIVAKVLQEIGVDISKENSKSMNEFLHTQFDIIITTTPEAREKVSTLLRSTTKIHKEFDDPRNMKGNQYDKESAFRELRDEMHEWLNEFIVRHRLISK